MDSIIDSVIAHSKKGTHPRIMLTAADFDRIKNSDDVIYREGIKNVLSRAESFFDRPVAKHEIRDGIRLLYVSREVLDLTLNLGLAYRFTGEARYAERLYREMEAVSAFPDWNPRHFLDVGEMCNAFGIAYDWIYDWMNEEQKAIMRRAIVEKGFNTIMDDYLDRERSRTYRWYQDDPGDNWKYVCNGGAAVALLAICDEADMDPRLCQDVFEYGFRDSYRAVRNMYMPDGSYVEGFTYWTYATTYLAYYVSAMRTAIGTDLGLTDYEPLIKSAYYVRSMCSGKFTSFNFGDASETSLCVDPYLFLGRNFSRGDVTAIRAEYLRAHPSQINPRDILWYEPLVGEPKPLSLDCGSVGGTNASFRSGWGEGDLFAAIHYGANDVCHAHADMGVFVVEWAGKRFIRDLGADNYNVPNYRNAYRYRAEGHNTIVINPSEKPDQVLRCESYINRYRSEAGQPPLAVCDMSVAYEGKSVVRGMLMPTDRSCVIVQDEITVKSTDTVYWFAHTSARIELAADRRSAILELDGDRMWVGLLADGELDVMKAEHMLPSLAQPGQNDNTQFSKLTVKTRGSCVISAVFAPLAKGESAPQRLPELTPIAEW